MTSPQLLRHLVILEDGRSSRVFQLDTAKRRFRIGRQKKNDIILHNHSVSRHHATLVKAHYPSESQLYVYRIVDGNCAGNLSTNGIKVNGKPCESRDLRHGDVITFGSSTAKMTYYIAEEASILENQSTDEAVTGALFPKEKKVITPIDRGTYHSFGEDLPLKHHAAPEDLHHLASFARLSPYPIIEINLQGQISYLNSAANLEFRTIKSDEPDHPILKGLLRNNHNDKGSVRKREVQVEDKIFEQYIHFLPEKNCIRSYLFDISELKFRASHDVLTRLSNRSCFNEQLSYALANANRHEYPLAVMFLDLDNFKNINTTLGHRSGDELLKQFAERLLACVRVGDTVARWAGDSGSTVARWGGDEFTLLLPRISNDNDTVRLAERILQELKRPFEIAGETLHVKSSIGIAIYPKDGLDEETLVKNADASLFRAKEEGGDCYRFYSSTMTSKASLLLRLDKLLSQAIENDLFSLYYQPQINLKTKEVTGVEALLRCFHPELNQIPLMELISMIEQTRLINPFSEWVLRTACQQNKSWQNAGLKPIPVAVNFSPRQFQQTELLPLVDRVLSDTGLDPRWLEVEIIETSLLHDFNAARESLNKLRDRGILLSMDDFGTGYSSLSYLQQFSFNTLKIDRSFITDLSEKSRDMAIVSAAIALGESFHLRVVAEGVETVRQLNLLDQLNCQEVQGYLFSRPIPPDQATLFLQEHL